MGLTGTSKTVGTNRRAVHLKWLITYYVIMNYIIIVVHLTLPMCVKSSDGTSAYESTKVL